MNPTARDVGATDRPWLFSLVQGCHHFASEAECGTISAKVDSVSESGGRLRSMPRDDYCGQFLPPAVSPKAKAEKRDSFAWFFKIGRRRDIGISRLFSANRSICAAFFSRLTVVAPYNSGRSAIREP